MPAFKDANGREWLVKLDGPKIRAVRSECKIDLTALDGNTFEQLERDPCLLVDCLWVLCRGQNSGVSDVQFGEALVGDPIGDATDALVNAIADFFPQRKRLLLRSLAEKQAAIQDKAIALALEKINDPTLETTLLASMQANLAALTGAPTATSSPVTAESTRPG